MNISEVKEEAKAYIVVIVVVGAGELCRRLNEWQRKWVER